MAIKKYTFDAWGKVDNNNHNRTCTLCGTVETSAHTWNGGAVTKNATCKETGVKTFTCTTCNATKTESIAKTSDYIYMVNTV